MTDVTVRPLRPADTPRLLDLIRMSTTAFWDAHLQDDADARTWLHGPGVRRALGEDGTFENKKAGP